MRVLIVDDGPSGDDFAHHLKAMYGAECFVAKRFDKGLQMFSETSGLDAVVCDLSLPDSSREQTVERLREFVGRGIPVYVFTGYADHNLFEQSLMAGADDWFLKGPYRDDHGVDRGSAALAKRIFVDWKKRNGINGKTSKFNEAMVRDAQAVVAPSRARLGWLQSPWANISLFATQIGVLVTLVWNAALFSRQVATNTNDIVYLKTRDEIVKMENKGSADNRATIDKRLDKFEERMNGFDTKMDGLKTDISNIPWKVRDLISDGQPKR